MSKGIEEGLRKIVVKDPPKKRGKKSTTPEGERVAGGGANAVGSGDWSR
jgi:hypothetical protein